ncbi:hypothetical protein Ddye_017777 [Dipteronia dyeriana]|uniref:RING-type E3 ubiquitin transferase n=1 Tax=Dipteronia dyeriana TaxID=168575 RepID=A0AAD9UA12_9ROSI|nr:hypothetical protein Ddye_017777 [Dipteronia dyeriana]
MARTSETVHESSLTLANNDETVYVAVEKDSDKSKMTLSWALSNFHGKKFCILHVHQLAKVISLIGGNSPGSRLEEHEVRTIRELDTKIMEQILDEYILMCEESGVYAEKLHVEMDDIREGIVELVYQHSIKKLVIGAAADKHYSGGMRNIKSKKAMYVLDHLPLSCQIWFICRGHLIRSGKGVLDGDDDEDRYASLQSISFSEMGGSNPSTSASGSSNLRCYESESEQEVLEQPRFLEVVHLPSSHELEGSSDDQLLDQLQQAQEEAGKWRREAYEEANRREKAEKTVIDATRKVRALEGSYIEELRRRKEIEEVSAKDKENFENMTRQWDEERVTAQDQRILLESQVSNYEYRMAELDDKRQSAEELSQVYEKERDMFRVERDNAFNVTNDLLKQSEASSSSSIINTQQFFSMFSLSEIHEATSSFDQSLLIWEHGHGTIYKGLIRYTPVAIKILNPREGSSVFQEEEECGLVYEYLPNGCLRDRLSCKDSTPPLSWQTRICIATELCSALIYLHSSNPRSIVHGDLKAENIFLGAGFVCKLSGFGVSNHPLFLQTGELSPKSDIYSFGIIVLQLLTGRSRANIVEEMLEILDMSNLNALLDSSAGDWPFVQAEQVAHLALRCCDSDPSNRPDLVSEVWRVLKTLRASCGALSSIQMDPEEDSQAPSYFICPILQEVMQDPVFAADGYTYEKEALSGWLESGHDTSPMTNLRLSHTDLVPNRALRSAIQEWLQHPS